MIKFFRNIRKSLLKEGKTTNYLKYAIGEIILVVIGILIALQINNWNEDRKLMRLEKSYYRSLLDDLKQDSLEFQSKKHNAERNIKKLNNILSYIDNNYNIEKATITNIEGWHDTTYKDTLALVFSLSQAGFVQFPQIYNNTITDLRTTGNIKLLKNEALKNKILRYYNRQNLVDSWVTPLMSAREDMETLLNSILSPYERTAYSKLEFLTMKKVDYVALQNRIKQRPELRACIIGMLHLHNRIIMEYNREFKRSLPQLMASIKEELKK